MCFCLHLFQWTRFNDSPTSSVLSSPGIKPVNFDFQKSSVEQVSVLLHPLNHHISHVFVVVQRLECKIRLRQLRECFIRNAHCSVKFAVLFQIPT